MTVSKKGVQIGEAKLYSIALVAAKKQGLQLIAEEEGQYALFQAADGAYHFVVAPSWDDEQDPRSLVKKMEQLKAFLASHKLDLDYPNKNNLHTHYFLCQTKGTQHFVYAYVDNTGRLRIKDSFPQYKPNAHKKDIMQHIPKDESKKHRYIHTDAQYNSSDCGHYALYYFKQDIGAKKESSFLKQHARKIGFVAGFFLVATLLTIGLVLSGFAITPLIIGVSACLVFLGGVVGSQWADVFDLTLHEERYENAQFLQEYNQEQQAINGMSHQFGSNAAKQLAQLPQGVASSSDDFNMGDDFMDDPKPNSSPRDESLVEETDFGCKIQ